MVSPPAVTRCVRHLRLTQRGLPAGVTCALGYVQQIVKQRFGMQLPTKRRFNFTVTCVSWRKKLSLSLWWLTLTLLHFRGHECCSLLIWSINHIELIDQEKGKITVNTFRLQSSNHLNVGEEEKERNQIKKLRVNRKSQLAKMEYASSFWNNWVTRGWRHCSCYYIKFGV